jgi:hypothetical protein
MENLAKVLSEEAKAGLLARGMNEKQVRVLEAIYAGSTRFDAEYGRSEVKEFTADPLDEREGPVTFSILLVTGRPNDEGTNAEVLCRTRRHFFIGVRGGVQMGKWNDKAKRMGWLRDAYSIIHYYGA